MNPPERLRDAGDLSINQLYMYSTYGESLHRGFCTEITEQYAKFKRLDWNCHDKVDLSRDKYNTDKLWVYNRTIYHKYQQLLKQQAQERKDLFLGKPVIVEQVAKKKWYERFLRRKKNV